MSRPRPRLYDLLPAYVRYRDALEGAPLRAVMDTLEVPYRAVLEDVEALYDGWFIETCELWRVPYIADLLGVRGLGVERHLHPGQRARVGNALAYRRRKGTAAALERVAADAAGWPCRLIEYRRTTATTAALRVEPGGGTADLRRAGDLDALGGPFNVVSHGVDLKQQDGDTPPLGDAGGFHPAGLGLALHRLAAYPVTGGAPRRVAEGCYTFHPMGVDAPLFHPARSPDEAVYRSRPDQLPAPLRPRALHGEIEARRQGALPASDHLGEPPALRIFVRPDGGEDGDGEGRGGPVRALEPAELEVCDLREWRSPARSPRGVRALVDPRRGRFRLLSADGELRPVRVDYHYGAAMDLGGGAYPRPAPPAGGGRERWTALVSPDGTGGRDAETGVHRFPTLDAALEAWNRHRSLPIPPPERRDLRPRDGVVQLADSGLHPVSTAIQLHGRRLRIEALDGCRPCLAGDLHVAGPESSAATAAEAGDGGGRTLASRNRLVLSGLWIDGGVRMRGSVSLRIEHCTIDPPRAGRQAACAVGPEGYGAPADLAEGAVVPSALHAFAVQVRHSILGPLRLAGQRVDLEIDDSLVDGGGGAAVEADQGQVRLVRCTLLGEVTAGRLPVAVDSLFTAPLRVAVHGEGAVVSCRLAAGSRTPQREMCVEGDGALLTSATYGHPGYGQLAPAAGRAVLEGAGDGNEIGVFNALRQRDRLDSLRAVLREHLPWGMRPRVWFVT